MCSARARRGRSASPAIAGCSPTPGPTATSTTYVSHRWSLADTPAIRIGGRRALELAGTAIDDVALVDLYSCFPSAVQLGAASLGLDLDAQLTRTGGLTLRRRAVEQLRRCTRSPRSSASCASGRPSGRWSGRTAATSRSTRSASTPPCRRRRVSATSVRSDRSTRCRRATLADGDAAAAAPATIEAYTVMFDRGGTPEQAIAACLLRDGRRAWATSDDVDAATAMTDRRVGRPDAFASTRQEACMSDSTPAAPTRPRVILDCDPGHDDAIAIVVAAHRCELAGITTVAGNAPLDRTTHNALVMRELLGIDVPVHAGAARPLARRAGRRRRRPRRQRARRRRPAGADPSGRLGRRGRRSSSRRAATSRERGSSASGR